MLCWHNDTRRAHTQTRAHTHAPRCTCVPACAPCAQTQPEKGRSCSVCWGEHIAWGFSRGEWKLSPVRYWVCIYVLWCACALFVRECVCAAVCVCECQYVISCNIATVILGCEAVLKALTLSLWDCFAPFVLEMPCSSNKVSFIVEFKIKTRQCPCWRQFIYGNFWWPFIKLGAFQVIKQVLQGGYNVNLRVRNCMLYIKTCFHSLSRFCISICLFKHYLDINLNSVTLCSAFVLQNHKITGLSEQRTCENWNKWAF